MEFIEDEYYEGIEEERNVWRKRKKNYNEGKHVDKEVKKNQCFIVFLLKSKNLQIAYYIYKWGWRSSFSQWLLLYANGSMYGYFSTATNSVLFYNSMFITGITSEEVTHKELKRITERCNAEGLTKSNQNPSTSWTPYLHSTPVGRTSSSLIALAMVYHEHIRSLFEI